MKNYNKISFIFEEQKQGVVIFKFRGGKIKL